MTAPGMPPVRASAAKRYGPLVAILVGIVVVAVVATTMGKKDDSTATSGSSSTTVAGSAAASATPLTWDEAKAQGRTDAVTWVDNCDKTTGRIMMPSVYAPPCVEKPTGANGGATAPGVTAEEIVVVVYVASQNGDLLSRFTSNLDDEALVQETGQKYIEMLSDLFETYGRKLRIERFNAQGAWNDPVAAQADAKDVIEKFHPFASIGGPALTGAYAEELVKNDVMCLNCGISNPDSFYQDNAPYIWGPLPTAEEFLVNVGDYVTNRLNGRPAEFAGGDLKGKTRKFGVVHFEQDPPVFKSVEEITAKCGADRGWKSEVTETYLFDIGKMAERATSIIAKMKEAGVTTIIFLGDPIMPINLTQQATAQDYFPEWMVTGTVLTDTTVLGRMYDPKQWEHAFGLSNLALRVPREENEPWRLHEWYYGTPPAAVNTNAIIYPPLFQLLLGVHMAGPNLSAETFKAGMFKYPQSGGNPVAAHVSYGDHGYYKMIDPETCEQGLVRPDYLGTDDMVEIFWDPTAEGPDEQGKTDKPGMWRYANGGKRYLPGQMPNSPPDAFQTSGSVTMLEEIPADLQPPSYPPPAGAPAASGGGS